VKVKTMLNPDFQRDTLFVFIYFDRYHEIEANGGIKNRLELLVRKDMGLGYWFSENKTLVTDMEHFLRDLLLRKV